jgi:hypothetical protein
MLECHKRFTNFNVEYAFKSWMMDSTRLLFRPELKKDVLRHIQLYCHNHYQSYWNVFENDICSFNKDCIGCGMLNTFSECGIKLPKGVVLFEGQGLYETPENIDELEIGSIITRQVLNPQ